MSPIPTFDDVFVNAIAESLRKRRKALVHSVGHMKAEKVREIDNGIESEKLEVELRTGTSRNDTSVRMHVWQERWIWVDVRKGSKLGWVWSWQYEGRPLGDIAAQAIIAALEETYGLAYGMDASRTQEFENVWRTILARGPVSVR